MKHFLTSLLFCFFAFQMCRAQDTTIVLHSGMYDKTLQEIYINKLDGWLFKKGNDTVWAKNDIDLSGWKKFKPVELSAEQADKNGKFEGWFRIKIKPDTSFGDKPLGINLSSWAACDVYINGELKASNGNTGQNGTPFREPGSLHHSTYPANLVPGNEYTIAVYVVDYLSPFPPRHLKSADGDNNDLISIAGPDFNSTLIPVIIKWTNYPAAWISVCSILSLLFWLLAFQNRNEKNLRLIALCTSFFALNLLCITIHNSAQSITYFSAALYSYSASLFFILYTLLMPLILAKIFKRKVTGLLKIFLAAYFIISMAGLFLPGAVWVIAPLFALITVCIYYIISSRKRLKGPPWAIAAGLLISLVWALLFFFMFAKYQSFTFPYAPLFISGVYLSFPLSLMVYVAMRFKEIIQEVQQHAKQVVQLSEEKREQALNQQKILQEEVNRQTAEIRISLENLKSAQAQLIQSEKMASLGELTAGIAHEIQNPLNFVNNFSEVNKEMLDEAEEEISRGNFDEVKNILRDIKDNSQKINHHGKRADAIVKGMLQHSRKSSGIKELTDINALCDEYLRLSYHGLRAKDKSFNAKFETDFDPSLPKINMVPQEIGRVILNLINNAFYATNERKKLNEKDYEPYVTVSTRRVNYPLPGTGAGGEVEIRVKDNGTGIPSIIKDKIFQPFFTTKPTGSGTGLGLSLAYDIITKGHGGELSVESGEGEGCLFKISLPLGIINPT